MTILKKNRNTKTYKMIKIQTIRYTYSKLGLLLPLPELLTLMESGSFQTFQ